MDKIVIVSVVRDMAMYNRCIGRNQLLSGVEKHPIDNSSENAGIGVCYNRFISGYDFACSAWFVFCHEDFEIKEDSAPLLANLDKNALWGPIGASTKVRFGVYHQWNLVGQVEQSDKDGSNLFVHGTATPLGTKVETFDCQCLIVHSSLIARHNLRFDEHLTFDLYVEDFCMAAAKKGVASRILPIKAQHWSGGNVLSRYAVQEAYINKKYPDDCFTGTSSWILGGRPPLFRRLTVAVKKILMKVL